jgi:hypothetical protein
VQSTARRGVASQAITAVRTRKGPASHGTSIKGRPVPKRTAWTKARRGCCTGP